MNKHLIILTSLYPFGNAETFLETEIKFSCFFFKTVTIIPLNQTLESREIPGNCAVLPFNKSQKINLPFLIQSFFKPFILKELISSFYKKNTIGILKTMCVSLLNAAKIKTFIETNFNPGVLKNTLLYSYWCDESALALALMKNSNPNLVTISRTHGWDLYFETNKYGYLPFKPFITNNLNAIFPISGTGKKYILNQWKTKIIPTTAYLGVYPMPYNGTSSKEKIIVSCSNVIKIKRVELILEALYQIENIQIKWVHFGDGVELQKLKTRSLILPSNISVEWKGRVKNEDVLKFYEEIKPSLFINVSSTEGIPVSIMEAMAFSIPVIATNVGGTSEIVDHENNGLLLNENPSIEEIRIGIEYLFSLEKTKFEFLKKNAFNTVNEKFNANTNYSNFYEQCLSFFNE